MPFLRTSCSGFSNKKSGRGEIGIFFSEEPGFPIELMYRNPVAVLQVLAREGLGGSCVEHAKVSLRQAI